MVMLLFRGARVFSWARSKARGMGTEGQPPQSRPSRRDFIHDPETHPRVPSFSKGGEGKRYITEQEKRVAVTPSRGSCPGT